MGYKNEENLLVRVIPLQNGFFYFCKGEKRRGLAAWTSLQFINVLLTELWTVMILLCLFQESKNIIFTS
jgi:hypothetical protein